MASLLVNELGLELSGSNLGDDDVFQCGRCKRQFNSLISFISHKRTHCQKSGDSSNSSTLENKAGENGVGNYVSSVVIDADDVENSKNIFFAPNLEQPAFGSSEKLSSVVVTEGELFLSALDGSQVYTLNENIKLSSAEGIKMVGEISSPAFPLETTLILETAKPSVNDLFHERMARSTVSKDENCRSKSNHSCPYCDRVFNKNFDLQQHLRSHTGEKPFQCVVCGRPFAQKSNAKKHILTHKVWPDRQAASSRASSSENKDDFGISNSYECPFCDQSFNSHLELKTHRKVHSDQKVYRCIQKGCEKTFLVLESFLDHIRSHAHHSEYECHVCSRSFGSLPSLGYHQLEHSRHPSNESASKTRNCTKCKENFATLESLNSHLKNVSHDFPCSNCSKVYSSMRKLKRHALIHSLQLYTCPICGKALKGLNSLRGHEAVHAKTKAFKCHLCNMASSRNDRLKRHMLMHEEKSLECPFRNLVGCLREFRRNDKLRLHIASHPNHLKRKKKKGKIEKKAKTPEGKVPDSNGEFATLSATANSKEENAAINKDLMGCMFLTDPCEGKSNDDEWVSISLEDSSLQTVPDSDFIVSYSEEEVADEHKDWEVLYFPFLPNFLASRSSRKDDHPEASGAAFVETENDLALATCSQLGSLGPEVLLNEATLQVIDGHPT